MSKIMVSLRFAPRMTRSYAQSVSTSKGLRPDLIPQRLDERTALRAYRRQMRPANEAGLLASLFLSLAFGTCAKKNNGASHKKNDISSIFRLSSLVYILY